MNAPINQYDFERRMHLVDNTKRTQLNDDYTWGVGLIKIGSTYHAYIESWINDDGLYGYGYYGKIYHASSSNMLGPFNSMTELTDFQGLPGSAGAVFNPDPHVVGNEIVIYYTGTYFPGGITYPGGGLIGTESRNNQRIFVARTSVNTPSGPFTIEQVDLNPRPGEWDGLFVNNPVVYFNGQWQMSYKSSAVATPLITKIAIITSEGDIFGPWSNAAAPISTVTNVEEWTTWKEGGIYYTITKAQDATYVELLNGILLYSKTGNPDDWHLVTNKPRAYRLTTCNDDHSSQNRTRIERGFVYVEDGKPKAFFTACITTDNLQSFNIGRLLRYE